MIRGLTPLDTVQASAMMRVVGITLRHAIGVASGKSISLPLWNTSLINMSGDFGG